MGISDGDSNASYMASYNTDYTNGEDTFADIHNLDHCIKYLNQSLVTFGFPSALNLYSSEPASIVRTCNCIYAVIQQRQRDIEYRETANDTRQRLMSDMSRLEAKVERLTDQLSSKERELQALASKEQKASNAFKAQLEKLQQEKDEFQRMVITTQQVRTQQNHELKKKEKEYVKLQERLNQVLLEKKKESKTGMEIMNLLQKEGRQRGTWNTKKADGDFYKMIVDAYEAKKQELVAENADLRSLLRSMQVDMRDFLNTPNVMSRSGSAPMGCADLEPPPTPLRGRTDVFDLPFHMARDQIEQSLRAKMSSIKERMMQLQEAQKGTQAADSSERELRLEAQLVEARSIIDEQVQATLMTKQCPEGADNRSVQAQDLEAAKETLCAAPEKGNAAQDEREALNEMAQDLDKERMETVKEKHKVAEEKASWASQLHSLASTVGGETTQALMFNKQDQTEVAHGYPDWLINHNEPAETRRHAVWPEIVDGNVQALNSMLKTRAQMEISIRTLPGVPIVFPAPKCRSPWREPGIWEKLSAPAIPLSETQAVQIGIQKVQLESHDLKPQGTQPETPSMEQCEPNGHTDRFESVMRSRDIQEEMRSFLPGSERFQSQAQMSQPESCSNLFAKESTPRTHRLWSGSNTRLDWKGPQRNQILSARSNNTSVFSDEGQDWPATGIVWSQQYKPWHSPKRARVGKTKTDHES